MTTVLCVSKVGRAGLGWPRSAAVLLVVYLPQGVCIRLARGSLWVLDRQSLRLRILQDLHHMACVVRILSRVHRLNRKANIWVTTGEVLGRSTTMGGVVLVHLRCRGLMA